MAGLYADVPGRWLPWDRDGTAALIWTGGALFGFSTFAATFTDVQARAVNGGDPGTSGMTTYDDVRGYAWVFPALRTLRGYYIAWFNNSSQVGPFEWSANSTNGQDGTWTTIDSTVNADSNTSDKTRLRTQIQTGGMPITGVKALRFTLSSPLTTPTHRLTKAHWYVDWEDTDRLALWHPTLNQEHGAAHFDYGDASRAVTYTKDFRVKNLAALAAVGVVVTLDVPTELSPAIALQQQLSADGGATWHSSVNIGDLDPGETSGVLTQRYIVDVAAALGLGQQRIIAAASSWT